MSYKEVGEHLSNKMENDFMRERKASLEEDTIKHNEDVKKLLVISLKHLIIQKLSSLNI